MSLQKGYKGAVALEMNLERAFLYVGTQVVESWRRGGEMQIDGMWSGRITSGKWWQEEIKSERGREGGSGREREREYWRGFWREFWGVYCEIPYHSINV